MRMRTTVSFASGSGQTFFSRLHIFSGTPAIPWPCVLAIEKVRGG
jgi:hypothetical protein